MKVGFWSVLTLSALAVGGSGVLAGTAAQENDAFTRSLTVAQKAIYDVRPAVITVSGEDELEVVAWVDRPNYTYAVGEPVRIWVQTNKDAYVTVLNTDPGGETTQLFPNQYQSENLIRANRTVEVPDPDSRSRIVVTGEVGDELLKIVASTSPVSLFEAQQLTGGGPFQVVRTQATTTARSLSVVISGQGPATETSSTTSAPGAITRVSTGDGTGAGWAVCHQKIKTVPELTLAARQTRSLAVRTSDSSESVRCEE